MRPGTRARRWKGQHTPKRRGRSGAARVDQVLLRYDDERHWPRTAPGLIGHVFPRLPAQGEYNLRLRHLAPLTEAALRWLADATPATAEPLRLMDATPVPCGTSAVTARRSGLFGYAGYGYCPSHSRWYRGSKLLILCACDGTVTGFSLANPKLAGERDQARQTPGTPAREPARARQHRGDGQGPVRAGHRGLSAGS